MNEQVTSPPQLRIERAFDAPREDVFDAWTNPEVLLRWWAAGPDWRCLAADVDLRVGGRYRLAMRDARGEIRVAVGGEYTEVQRPERLVYTWSWEPGPGDGETPHETLVRVDFEEEGGRTNVVLTHTGFSDEDSRDRHGHGWGACLDNLDARVFAGPA